MRISRKISMMVLALVCFGAAFQPAPARQQDQQPGQGELDTQNDVIRNSNRKLAELAPLIEGVGGDIMRSEAGRKLVRNEIAAKREIVRAFDSEIKQITTEINADARRVRELENSLTTLKTQYGKQVRSAWKDHKMNTSTAFLLSSRDFNDATRRISYIRRYNRAREQKGAEIDSLNRDLKAKIEKLDAKKTELSALKTESAAVVATLSKDEAKYDAALKTLTRNRKELEDAARKERQKITAAQRRIDKIMADQAKSEKKRVEKEGLSQAEIALSGRFEDNKGRLPWPAGGSGTVLDHFGIEKMADGIQKESKGITVAARRGSEVKAVFEGKVTGVYGLEQFGRGVTVRSGNYVVVYGNLDEIYPKVGDTMTLGQAVGTLPGSGDVGKCALLFQIWRETTALDPEQWLRK